MEHSALLDLSVDLGCGLLESGAEIYRAEDSVRRLLAAYELEGAEVFAIPNCLIASVTTPAGEPLTRVRRVPEHGTDIWRLERYNALCRALCRDTPPPETARAMLARVEGERREYPLPVRLLVGPELVAFAGTHRPLRDDAPSVAADGESLEASEM